MPLLQTPVAALGSKAHDFSLPGTDGRRHTLASTRGPLGTLVMFICNHCPYVKAIQDRLVDDVKVLQKAGIGVVAISANDPAEYPEDAFPEMQKLAKQLGFTFPYLFDETQEVAKAYGAVCTPDFFGYNANGELQYRGRLDASGRNPGPPDATRELFAAMRLIAESGAGPAEQTASIGCSIKWRTD